MDVKQRFLKYVSYGTTSDENSLTCPSTPGQTVLLLELKNELVEMGVDAKIDQNGYVTAMIPANKQGLPSLCFIAHVDTSSAVSGENVIAREIEYTGGDIYVGNGITIALKDNPELNEYIGDNLIVTDGSTLLGADDKAGVAEIMTAVNILVNGNMSHGDVWIAFTPDEEIGRGVDLFDLENFHADFGYTVDGGKLGEIEYENFNAASAVLTITGSSVHPGSAKNKMKNAIDIFTEFHTLLPVEKRPVNTEKYEGFYMAENAEGGIEKFSCKYIIRDHDISKFENKKTYFINVVNFLNNKYGEGTLTAKIEDSYYNMAEIIKGNFHLIDNAQLAMRQAGVEPIVVPIRGGTDGAMLAYKGLPCPNLSTGGHNYHGRMEYIPVKSMEKMVEVILNIIGIYAK